MLAYLLLSMVAYSYTKNITVVSSVGERTIHADLYLGRQETIETFEHYGIDLDHLLVHSNRGFHDAPCRIERFKIATRQDTKLDQHLVGNIQESTFRDSYHEGILNVNVNQLLNFVHLEAAVAVVTSEPRLYFIMGDKNARTSQIAASVVWNQSLDIAPSAFVYLGYSYITHKLYLIQNGLTYSLKIEKPSEIVAKQRFNSLQPLNGGANMANIQSVYISSLFLYVSRGKDGLAILYDDGNGNLITILEILKGDIVEAKVVTLDKVTEVLYLLDRDSGIWVYQVYANLTTVTDSIINWFEMDPVGQKGAYVFDIYRNSMVVAFDQGHTTLVRAYHLDVFKKTWSQLNEWKVQGHVRDIDMTDEFAILVGVNGHHIVFHSAPTLNENHKLMEELPIPSLLKLDFFSLNLKEQQYHYARAHTNIMVGITKHSIFAMEWVRIPIKLVCYSENRKHIEASPLLMKLHLNTTQCPEKLNTENDLVVCSLEQEYSISFKRAIFVRPSKPIIYGSIILLGLLLLVFCYRLCKHYHSYSTEHDVLQNSIDEMQEQGIYVDMPGLTNEQPTSPMAYQQAGLSSRDKTPVAEQVQQIENEGH